MSTAMNGKNSVITSTPTAKLASKNPFADIDATEILKPNAADVSAATSSASAAAASATRPHPHPPAVATVAYNPNSDLPSLDALSLSVLPDESENIRLSQGLRDNVQTIMLQKGLNEMKQKQVGTALAAKVKSMEEEQRKLRLIHTELSKLDASLSKNIDVLRMEIESVGREVHEQQKEFDIAEKHYLHCRKVLAKSKQRKLLLTSHLDFIILTNENEKARKLAELEMELGLTPSTPAFHQLPTPPVSTVPSATPPAYPASNGAPHHAFPASSGPSPAVAAAAAASEARLAAAASAKVVPKDHAGLKLEILAQPAFGGFEQTVEQAEEEPQQQSQPNAQPSASSQQHQRTSSSSSQPNSAAASNRPSPAAIATSRHVALPPRNAKQQESTAPPPRAAQSTLSIANKNRTSPTAYAPDGSFAGFTE